MSDRGNDPEPKEAKVVPFPQAARGRRCPECGRPAVVEFRPFCSRRCADVDLGRWLKGDYTVPGDEPASIEQGAGDPDEGA